MPGIQSDIVARLRLYGGFRLTTAEGRAIEVPSRRARALLAILALSADQSAPRERLCGLLWSDRGPAQARASLRQCLLDLRARLESFHLAVLTTSRESVGLLPGVACDARDLEQTLGQGRPEEVGEAIAALAGGVLLEDLEIAGLFEDWRVHARARLEDAIAAAVARRLERLEAEGDWRCARFLADAFLQRQPLDEGVVAFAMRADAALGDSSRARRRYRTLRDDLRRDLGVEPGDAARAALAGLDAPAAPRRSLPPPPEATTRPLEPRVAVLAFDNLGADEATSWFSDGLSEDILHAVALIPGLTVMGRVSSFRFRGADKDVARVAERLGVSHVLDGSVRRSGDQVRVQAALLEAPDGAVLWSERYDRRVSDVLRLQDEIARAVAAALRLVFGGRTPAARVDPAAYDLFLRARPLSGGLDHLDRCVTLLGEAVARSPDFAAAWSHLALAGALSSRWLADADTYPARRAAALRAAERAAALDPAAGLPPVVHSLLTPPGHFEAREALFHRALRAGEHNADLLAHAAGVLASGGRPQDGHGLILHAREVDPLNEALANAEAAILVDMGRPA